MHDAEWKQDTLKKLLDDLQSNNKELKEITKESVENELYDFFNNRMTTGDAPEIEEVRRFDGYLATNDNGIVINCIDGKQIRLTIQVD